MAKSVTIDQVLTDARLYADQRPGGANTFISDTEGLRLVNLTIGELYDLLVAARGHEYYAADTTIALTTDDVSTDSRVGRYALPADFYQLLTVAIEWADDDNEPLFPLDAVHSRTRIQNIPSSWERWTTKAYRLRAAQIEIIPAPTTDETMRLQYIPVFTDLTTMQSFDGVNGWNKLVALKVAMEMRSIEGQPYGDLEKLYEREVERVTTMASERDAGLPSRVVDVYPEGTSIDGWPPRPVWPRIL